MKTDKTIKPVKESEAIKIGLNLDKKYAHDQYDTLRYTKGPMQLEFTYEGRDLQTVDLTVEELDALPIDFERLKLFDMALNGFSDMQDLADRLAEMRDAVDRAVRIMESGQSILGRIPYSFPEYLAEYRYERVSKGVFSNSGEMITRKALYKRYRKYLKAKAENLKKINKQNLSR